MQTSLDSLALLDGINPDLLGVTLLLAVIFSFATLIATVITLIEAIKSVLLARISRSLIQDLLEKGFSPSEVAQLVNEPSRWTKVKNWMKFGKQAESPHRHPAPPVKQAVH